MMNKDAGSQKGNYRVYDAMPEEDGAVRVQAKALSDRTRFGIYNAIRSSSEPITVAELTSMFRLNHNAIRQHLAILVDAGLVREELEQRRTTPGRPRLFYSAGGQGSLAFGAVNLYGRSYNRLALLLAQAIDNNVAPREIGRAAGMRGAGATAGNPSIDSADIASVSINSAGIASRGRNDRDIDGAGKNSAGIDGTIRGNPAGNRSTQDSSTVMGAGGDGSGGDGSGRDGSGRGRSGLRASGKHGNAGKGDSTETGTVAGTGKDGSAGGTPDGDQALDRVMSALETEGFRTRIATRGKRIELIVDTCPFTDIAEIAPKVVCDLHLGVAEGVTAAAGGLTVIGLKKSSPLKSGCRLVLQHAAS
ncbi:MAG: helix-turn-helix domain-containing protein [Acidimicrobiales bacterium]